MSGAGDDDGKSQWSTRAQGGGYEEDEEGAENELDTSRFNGTIEGAEKRVLTKSGTSTMNRARQMFLLDQLKKPTPTADGPRMERAESFGSVESTSRFTKGRGEKQRGRTTEAAVSTTKAPTRRTTGGKSSKARSGSGTPGRVKSRRQGSRGARKGSRQGSQNELRGSVGRLQQTNRGE